MIYNIQMYNKILKEVLQVYDFDSWDDSEQTFKEKIHDQLEKLFIYKPPRNWGSPSNLQILDNREDLDQYSSNCDDWPDDLFNFYKQRVWIEGKKFAITPIGCTKEEIFDTNKEYHVYIEDLDGIRNCKFMFYKTDIKKVPMFDTSKCRDMQCMFYECLRLEHVPALNIDTIVNHYFTGKGIPQSVYQMFGKSTANLDEETIKIWFPEFANYLPIENQSDMIPESPTRIFKEKKSPPDPDPESYKLLPF